jgi:hypothetical protein
MELKDRMDQKWDAHIQNEIAIAKQLQAHHPDLNWTECLKKAKKILEQQRS